MILIIIFEVHVILDMRILVALLCKVAVLWAIQYFKISSRELPFFCCCSFLCSRHLDYECDFLSYANRHFRLIWTDWISNERTWRYLFKNNTSNLHMIVYIGMQTLSLRVLSRWILNDYLIVIWNHLCQVL